MHSTSCPTFYSCNYIRIVSCSVSVEVLLYRNESKARIEFNMETQYFDNPNMVSSTTVANDNVAKGNDHIVDDIGVKWRFDYKF